MILQVSMLDSTLDQPLEILAYGLAPGERVTLRLSMLEPHLPWQSEAEFIANGAGAIDLSRDAPVSGSYDDADAMGLIWSMRLPSPIHEKLMRGEIALDPRWGVEHGLHLSLSAEAGGQKHATTELIRRYMTADVTRTPLREQGVVGTMFHHRGQRRPGIIVVGGSGGGLDEFTPALLANHGYAALGLAYFGFENLPRDLYEIPLEYFGLAIEWMRRQPDVDADRLIVMGASRGGELALLLGATFAEIRGVIAYVPSGVTWPGIGREFSPQPRASWTWHGKPIAFVPPAPPTAAGLSGGAIAFTPWFLESLKDSDAVEHAEIEVERINGPVLMISGKDDQMWPSATLSEMAMRRLARHRFTHPHRHLSYDGAGHAITFPYTPSTITEIFHPVARSLMAFGGTPKATAAAKADAWRETLDFLTAHTSGM
jgi:dienelactone hydrolase